jgi:arachidonate 15-lipoxygenase
MTTPTLPQESDNLDARSSELDAARDLYKYKRDYKDTTFSDEVVKGEGFSATYMADIGVSMSKLLANRGAVGSKLGYDPNADGKTDGKERLEIVRAGLKNEFPSLDINSIAEYEALHAAVDLPRSAQHWRKDWYFAWQRLAGGYPMQLSRVRALPDNLPLTDEILRRSTTPTDTVQSAIEEGRLYVADYAILDGLEMGVIDGREKYLWAPIAVYAVVPNQIDVRAGFVSVAVQCNQTAGPDNRLWTPRDGMGWEMAKLVVQTADAHVREVGAHTGLCHVIMEAVLIFGHHNLSKQHPVLRLLEPHLEWTQPTNEVMLNTFVGPQGNMQAYQSPSNNGCWELIDRTLKGVDIGNSHLEADLAARGVDDDDLLPWYPYRDDGRLVLRSIRQWVNSFLRVYYTSDELVRGDHELQGWIRDLADPKKGGLNGVPRVQTFEQLEKFISSLLWRASPYHSAINYSGWEFLGFVPNSPTSAFAPGPKNGGNTEADLVAMLPPLNVAIGAMEVMYQISHTQHNRLGKYPLAHFRDRRVADGLNRFESELKDASKSVKERNLERPVPYVYLDPERIAASIHV